MHTLVDCVGLAEPNLAWHYCALDNLECHPKDSDVSLSQEPNVSSIPTALESWKAMSFPASLILSCDSLFRRSKWLFEWIAVGMEETLGSCERLTSLSLGWHSRLSKAQ